MTNLNETQLKKEFYKGLFENRVVKYKNPVDRKLVDVHLACKNESLDRFFNRLFAKYNFKTKVSIADFMSECAFHTFTAVRRFEIRDGGSWEGMIDGTDKANIGRFITNTKTTVENEIIRYANGDLKFTTGKIDGEVKHVKIGFDMTSLDTLIVGADGHESPMVEMVSADQSFWGQKHDYAMSSFLEWFHANKAEILTASQLQLLENLKKCGHEKDGYTDGKDIQRVLGFTPRLLSTYLDRIKTRTLKAWEKAQVCENKTHSGRAVEKELKVWADLMAIVNDDELETQNKRISEWFIEWHEADCVSVLICDTLNVSDTSIVAYAIRKKGEHEIPAKILYKLVAAAENRVEWLEKVDTTAVPFYMKPEENGGWTKERHATAAIIRKAFVESPCQVYAMNEDGSPGEWLREEKYVASNKPSNRIEVSPMGTRHDIQHD